jgi:hypothetical protein
MKEAHQRRKEAVFYMMGVIHGDKEGKALLDGWLESAAPDMVTLEFSRYGLNFRRSKGERLRRKARSAIDELKAEGSTIDESARDALFSYIDLPVEFAAASEYCNRSGAGLFLVDMDRFSSANLARMDEVISKENLRMLLSFEHSGKRRQKAIALLFFEKGIKAFAYTEEMRERDRHMSNKIGRLARRRAPSRLVHICGWQHICDPFGLYAAFSPKKAFIYDKALCV